MITSSLREKFTPNKRLLRSPYITFRTGNVGPVPGPEIRANEPPAPVETRGLDRRFFDDNCDCVLIFTANAVEREILYSELGRALH